MHFFKEERRYSQTSYSDRRRYSKAPRETNAASVASVSKVKKCSDFMVSVLVYCKRLIRSCCHENSFAHVQNLNLICFELQYSFPKFTHLNLPLMYFSFESFECIFYSFYTASNFGSGPNFCWRSLISSLFLIYLFSFCVTINTLTILSELLIYKIRG